jgi:hypothetical protein
MTMTDIEELDELPLVLAPEEAVPDPLDPEEELLPLLPVLLPLLELLIV